MSRENTSSVDMTNGKKLAYYAKQDLAAMKASFSTGDKDIVDQVVNAKKGDNLAKKKAKAKKRAKLAKASKKKNKK